jgi:hypothetical protein
VDRASRQTDSKKIIPLLPGKFLANARVPGIHRLDISVAVISPSSPSVKTLVLNVF